MEQTHAFYQQQAREQNAQADHDSRVAAQEQAMRPRLTPQQEQERITAMARQGVMADQDAPERRSVTITDEYGRTVTVHGTAGP